MRISLGHSDVLVIQEPRNRVAVYPVLPEIARKSVSQIVETKVLYPCDLADLPEYVLRLLRQALAGLTAARRSGLRRLPC